MAIKFRCFLLLPSILFLSCQSLQSRQWSSEDLFISDQETVQSLAFPKSISSEQAAEDIDFLIYVLKTAYGGRNYVPGNSFTKEIDSLKAIPKNISMSDFHQKIDEALFIIPDNHMRCYYLGKVSQKRQNFDDSSKGHVGKNNITDSSKIWETRIDRVGEHTNGTFHFSNAGIVVLPNSKFKITIPSQYSEYHDQRFIERVGLSPDMRINPGEDAYKEIKKIIIKQ